MTRSSIAVLCLVLFISAGLLSGCTSSQEHDPAIGEKLEGLILELETLEAEFDRINSEIERLSLPSERELEAEELYQEIDALEEQLENCLQNK